MNSYDKQKLLRYICPTDEIRSFLFNDFVMELLNIISEKEIFNRNNLNDTERKKNLIKVIYKVENFILKNPIYNNRIKELYKAIYKERMDDFVIALAFYISSTKDFEIDIFKDKRSICYDKISIMEIL